MHVASSLSQKIQFSDRVVNFHDRRIFRKSYLWKAFFRGQTREERRSAASLHRLLVRDASQAVAQGHRDDLRGPEPSVKLDEQMKLKKPFSALSKKKFRAVHSSTRYVCTCVPKSEVLPRFTITLPRKSKTRFRGRGQLSTTRRMPRKRRERQSRTVAKLFPFISRARGRIRKSCQNGRKRIRFSFFSYCLTDSLYICLDAFKKSQVCELFFVFHVVVERGTLQAR